MLKISDNSKIYVYCPAGYTSGGPELLHQLVHLLNNNNKDAYIVYIGDKPHVVPAEYKNYNIKIAETVEDNEKNVEVFPEGRFDMISINKKCQKLLWWLSVDNFFKSSTSFLSPLDIFKYSPKLALRAFIKQMLLSFKGKHKGLITLKRLSSMDCLCGYQSEYAQNFLQNNGFKEIAALKDYINIELNNPIIKSKKENIILYNPSKGYSFTKKIFSKDKNHQWIALKGMSRKELGDIMSRAKLYVDFGNHPGKDRLPRECAMNGCCIITGMRGSAKFFEDVMIPSQYKFDEKNCKIDDIIYRINTTISNYDNAIEDFALYRKMIANEKHEFEVQVANIFGL